MTDENLVPCGSTGCFDRLDADNPCTVSVTRSIWPHDVTYYHSACYDPWAEDVGHGAAEAADPVNNPAHYKWLPNGTEVIDITENFDFLVGNVLKYILRAEHKGKPLEDMKKARWYLDRAIARRESSE